MKLNQIYTQATVPTATIDELKEDLFFLWADVTLVNEDNFQEKVVMTQMSLIRNLLCLMDKVWVEVDGKLVQRSSSQLSM